MGGIKSEVVYRYMISGNALAKVPLFQDKKTLPRCLSQTRESYARTSTLTYLIALIDDYIIAAIRRPNPEQRDLAASRARKFHGIVRAGD